MGPHFIKRLHLVCDLTRRPLPPARLPDGYAWAGWHPALTAQHALVKHEAFAGELDTQLFTSLAERGGCDRLMQAIVQHEGFLPHTTWLIRFVANQFAGPVSVATVQGLEIGPKAGCIQNVAVSPLHRGIGLGRALLLKSLSGFQWAGIQRVQLEVTATNTIAIKLYRSLGFEHRRTSFREIEPQTVRSGPVSADTNRRS